LLLCALALELLCAVALVLPCDVALGGAEPGTSFFRVLRAASTGG
jgi:hypothetical protein